MFGGYAIVLAVAMFLIVGVCASAWAQDVEADIAAITEAMNQATLAVGTGDVELYLSRFTEDVVAMPPGIPPSIGIAQLRAAVEGLCGAYDLELPYTVQEVEVSGDWAFARSTFVYSMTPKEGGETATFIGKELDIFKRQADGSWKRYIECYNFDAPPPAAKRAGTSWAPGLAKPAQEDDADIAAVKEVHNQYAAAVIAGDVDAWVSLWSDDGVRMAPDAPTFFGKEEIRASVEDGFDLFSMQMTIDFAEVVVSGDWAFARGPYTHMLTPKAGGKTSSFVGKYLTIFQRQADGSWKIYIDCFNYDGPPTITSVEATSWGQVKALFE